MKLSLSKRDQAKLLKLFECKNINVALGDLLMEYFLQNRDFAPIESKQEMANKMVKFWNEGYLDRDDCAIISELVTPNIEEVNPAIITENPYFSTVKIPEIHLSNIEYKNIKYHPYQAFARDEIEVDSNYREYSKVGYFKEEMNFPALTNKYGIWMAIIPNEIFTMAPAIEKAHGHVLTYGLGLGYFAYMCHLKEDVKSITIVEKDKHVIDLFNQYIRPYFDEKKCPISIIKCEAFSFETRQHYDYAFVDIYHDPSDGLPVFVRFMKRKKKMDIDELDFWLKESLYAYYRRLMIYVFECVNDGLGDEHFSHSENQIDDIINEIYRKTKKMEFNDYNSIHRFLSKGSIDDLLTPYRFK